MFLQKQARRSFVTAPMPVRKKEIMNDSTSRPEAKKRSSSLLPGQPEITLQMTPLFSLMKTNEAVKHSSPGSCQGQGRSSSSFFCTQ
ncbi:hypothetical protein CSUI_001952 [Cystoisospora suis]|uniref:Uncharacterized protein n=1 Tax=Cystoisospora suis TaxID=483139 RepID=A0A2C6L9Z0_9APIC|nr:hypothetical protein CSUI_001952 [Cystoisospora suis]